MTPTQHVHEPQCGIFFSGGAFVTNTHPCERTFNTLLFLHVQIFSAVGGRWVHESDWKGGRDTLIYSRMFLYTGRSSKCRLSKIRRGAASPVQCLEHP